MSQPAQAECSGKRIRGNQHQVVAHLVDRDRRIQRQHEPGRQCHDQKRRVPPPQRDPGPEQARHQQAKPPPMRHISAAQGERHGHQRVPYRHAENEVKQKVTHMVLVAAGGRQRLVKHVPQAQRVERVGVVVPAETVASAGADHVAAQRRAIRQPAQVGQGVFVPTHGIKGDALHQRVAVIAESERRPPEHDGVAGDPGPDCDHAPHGQARHDPPRGAPSQAEIGGGQEGEGEQIEKARPGQCRQAKQQPGRQTPTARAAPGGRPNGRDAGGDGGGDEKQAADFRHQRIDRAQQQRRGDQRQPQGQPGHAEAAPRRPPDPPDQQEKPGQFGKLHAAHHRRRVGAGRVVPIGGGEARHAVAQAGIDPGHRGQRRRV